MKKIILIYVLLIFSVNLSKSQTGWVIQPAFTQKNLYGTGVTAITNIYTGSDSGIVFQSTDYGFNWNIIAHDTIVKRLPIRSVFGANNDEFYAVGDSAAYISKIGLQVTSSRIVTAPGLVKPNLGAISYIQGYVGYSSYVAAGDSGLFYLNETGLWRKDTAATRIAAGRKINYSSRFIFVGDNGFIMKADSIGIIRPNTERIKWRIISSPVSQNLYCVNVYSNGLCFAVGAGGVMIKSTDFGDNWVSIPSPTTENLYGFVLLYGNFVCGANGTILKCNVSTFDNWFRQTTPTSQDLHSIISITGTNCMAMGNNGIFLRTTDGGGPPAGITQTGNETPNEYYLSQNYPNPFNPVTKIGFGIPVDESVAPKVELKIYDESGREVETLYNGIIHSGKYEILWNAASMPSGVYFCRLEAGNFNTVKKMVLIK